MTPMMASKQLSRVTIALGLLAAAVPAHGRYIESLYPLQQFIVESDVIAEGTIERTDTLRGLCTIRISRSIKGRCHFEVVRVNLGTGQEWHPETVLPHLVLGAPAVIFYNAERRAEMYVNRFFLQLSGDPTQPPEKAWWTFTHIEVHCNRTFNGTTEELSRLLRDIQNGKAKAPPPDPKVPVITKASLKALPIWGQPIGSGALPEPFVRHELANPRGSREPENPPGLLKGLDYQYYEGSWNALPDFTALKPAAAGIADRFDLSVRKRAERYGLRFTGFIEIPREGLYHFYTLSHDGSKLFIGKDEVVSNDSVHPARESSGGTSLKAGRHSITLLFFQNEGDPLLDVSWEGPDIPKQKIPSAALSHSPTP
jgi:hypothetical protein